AAAVGSQQAADHAQRRGLARAVGPEEAADAALLDAEADMVDHGALAVALDQVVDVDRQRHGRLYGANGATVIGRPGGSLVWVGSGRASIRNTSLARALWE